MRFLLIIFVALPCWGDEINKTWSDLLLKAESSFQSQNWDDSHEAYSKLLELDPKNEFLLLNLSLTAIKQKNWPMAKAYNLAALRLNSTDQGNIKIYNLLKSQPTLKNSFNNYTLNQTIYESLGLRTSRETISWLFFILTCFFVLNTIWMAGRWYRSKKLEIKYKMPWLRTITISFLFFSVSYIYLNKVFYELKFNSVLVLPNLNLKSLPNEGGSSLGVVDEGSEVSLIQLQEDWALVELKNQKVGWLPKTSLFVIGNHK